MYKLLNQKLTAYDDYEYKVGEWHKPLHTFVKPPSLCNSYWLHCYRDPLLAVVMNESHLGIRRPKLFRVLVRGFVKQQGLKWGTTEMYLAEEVKLPTFSDTALLRSAIRAYGKGATTQFKKWATAFFRGESIAAEVVNANETFLSQPDPYSHIHFQRWAADIIEVSVFNEWNTADEVIAIIHEEKYVTENA